MSWIRNVSHARQVCTSSVKHAYHNLALIVARRANLASVNHHADGSIHHGNRVCGSLFKLGVSEEMVNRLFDRTGWSLHDISKATLLVPAKNRACNRYNIPAGWGEVAARTDELIKRIHPFAFIKYSAIERLPNYGDSGVCGGMAQSFIQEYLQQRRVGIDFKEAAIVAANGLRAGASKEACALQLLIVRATLDEAALENVPSNEKFAIRIMYHSVVGFKAFISEHPGSMLTTASPIYLTKVDISDLEDGIYYFITGWRRESATNRWFSKDLHAIALMVDSGRSLIFDPNYGLLEYGDPEVYFRIAKRSANGIFILSKITLDQTPPL